LNLSRAQHGTPAFSFYHSLVRFVLFYHTTPHHALQGIGARLLGAEHVGHLPVLRSRFSRGAQGHGVGGCFGWTGVHYRYRKEHAAWVVPGNIFSNYSRHGTVEERHTLPLKATRGSRFLPKIPSRTRRYLFLLQ